MEGPDCKSGPTSHVMQLEQRRKIGTSWEGRSGPTGESEIMEGGNSVQQTSFISMKGQEIKAGFEKTTLKDENVGDKDDHSGKVVNDAEVFFPKTPEPAHGNFDTSKLKIAEPNVTHRNLGPQDQKLTSKENKQIGEKVQKVFDKIKESVKPAPVQVNEKNKEKRVVQTNSNNSFP